MLVATVEKLNGNWYLMNFLDINSLEENILTNWVQCDGSVQNYYNSLKIQYGIVCIKEEDIQKGFINTDSFIFSEQFKDESDELEIKKAGLLQELDLDFSNNIKGINFMYYINFIMLFNYFASKGIFINEENKEDKYIEILELDDEEAIEKLEEYLTIQETVGPFMNDIKKNSALKEEISYSSEEEFEVIKASLV